MNGFTPRIVSSTDERLRAFEVGIICGDVTSLDLLKQKVTRADYILHLAANTGVQNSLASPINDCQTNIIGTLNLLELSRSLDVDTFAHASSAAPLGASTLLPHTEKSLPIPVSPYGVSKLAGEGYVSVYRTTFNLNAVSLRFSNVYGEGCFHKTSVVSKMAEVCLRK